MDKFNFKIGDVIEFCDQQYFVIENHGSKGVVNPIGENFYIRFFNWQYGEEVSRFVRKPTDYELDKLGLLNG
jgi:hypothetical protein